MMDWIIVEKSYCDEPYRIIVLSHVIWSSQNVCYILPISPLEIVPRVCNLIVARLGSVMQTTTSIEYCPDVGVWCWAWSFRLKMRKNYLPFAPNVCASMKRLLCFRLGKNTPFHLHDILLMSEVKSWRFQNINPLPLIRIAHIMGVYVLSLSSLI